MDSGDKARDALETIRERNEQSIVRAKLTEWSVSHDPRGDVRRLIHVLGEALDAHPVSVAADGEEHCPTCAWSMGVRISLDQCHLRQAILAGLLAEATSRRPVCPASPEPRDQAEADDLEAQRETFDRRQARLSETNQER